MQLDANKIAASFITQCFTTYGESAFYSPHRVVASRRGPRTNILLSRTSKPAMGSDVDCLIRHSLKFFCQLTAGFSGSLLATLCGDRHGTKGECGHALAIGELFAHSASITIAKKIDRKWHAIFRVVCQVGTFFFLRGDIMIHDSLHTIGTMVTHHSLYSCPMIARRLSACSQSKPRVSLLSSSSQIPIKMSIGPELKAQAESDSRRHVLSNSVPTKAKAIRT